MHAIFTKAAASALIAAFAVGIPVSGPASARGFKKAPVSISPAAKVKPKKLFLACMTKTASIAALGLSEHKINIRNTLGHAIPAGTRIYWSTQVRYGGTPKYVRLKTLGFALLPGYAFEFELRRKSGRCVAWIYAGRIG